jgi:hypothetical protein
MQRRRALTAQGTASMKASTMKKASKKKSSAKKSKTTAKTKPALVADAQGRVSGGMVDKQPQVKEQAAVAREMFLYDDDAWARRYFDQNDLHFLEREVFG